MMPQVRVGVDPDQTGSGRTRQRTVALKRRDQTQREREELAGILMKFEVLRLAFSLI